MLVILLLGELLENGGPVNLEVWNVLQFHIWEASHLLSDVGEALIQHLLGL